MTKRQKYERHFFLSYFDNNQQQQQESTHTLLLYFFLEKGEINCNQVKITTIYTTRQLFMFLLTFFKCSLPHQIFILLLKLNAQYKNKHSFPILHTHTQHALSLIPFFSLPHSNASRYDYMALKPKGDLSHRATACIWSTYKDNKRHFIQYSIQEDNSLRVRRFPWVLLVD